MSTTIQAFYKHVLTALSYQVGDDDLISRLEPGGGVRPATVDGRRLVLPSKARLKEGFSEDLQPFHPVGENIARRGASPVLNHMQRTAKTQLALYFNTLALTLMRVAADASQHHALSPACSEYLKKVPNADKRSVTDLEKLLNKAASKNGLITYYLRNGGTYEGKKVNRLCVIRFPVIEALDQEEETVYGVKLRKKDLKTFSALLRYIMPFGDDPEEYSAGSNSRIAPFFDAFMQAYGKAATQLNKMVKRFGKPLDIPLNEIDLSYMKDLKDLAQFYDKLPNLRGNEGTVSDEEEGAMATTAGTTPSASVTPTQTPPPPPSQPSRQAPAEPQGNKISVRDFLQQGRQPAPPPPAYAQPQQPPYGYGQPQPQAGYGGQPPHSYGQQHWVDPNNPFAGLAGGGHRAAQQGGYPPQGGMPPQAPINQFGGYVQPQGYPQQAQSFQGTFQGVMGGVGGNPPPWEPQPGGGGSL